MFKTRTLIPILVLSCLTLFLFLALTKAFWVIIQIMILDVYDDSTPLAHINAAVILLSLFLTLFWPQIMARVTSKTILGLGLIFGGICAVLYPLLELTFWGYVVALSIFVCANLLGISVLAIINASLNDKYRTTFMGIYNTLYNLSLGLGPFILVLLHNDNTPLYYGAGILFLAFSIPVFLVKKSITFKPKENQSPKKFLKKFSGGLDVVKDNKILFILILTTCLNMAMASHLLIFWGDSYNLPLIESKQLPTIFALGAVVTSIPISYVADRVGPLKIYLVTLTALICAYTYLSLDALFEPLDYVSLFILGGGISTSVAITSSYIGRLFSGYKLAQATAGFNFLRLLTGIGGLYVAGELIDQFEAYGLNWFMSFTNLILFVCLLYFCYQNRRTRVTLYEKNLHPN